MNMTLIGPDIELISSLILRQRRRSWRGLSCSRVFRTQFGDMSILSTG